MHLLRAVRAQVFFGLNDDVMTLIDKLLGSSVMWIRSIFPRVFVLLSAAHKINIAAFNAGLYLCMLVLSFVFIRRPLNHFWRSGRLIGFVLVLKARIVLNRGSNRLEIFLCCLLNTHCFIFVLDMLYVRSNFSYNRPRYNIFPLRPLKVHEISTCLLQVTNSLF